MEIITIILLILLGIILLFVEFALIPGVTIAGVGAVIAFGYGIFLAYSNFGIAGGIITALIIVILSPILIIRFFKGKAAKKLTLETNINSKVDLINHDKIKIGGTGITLSRLAPVGKASIEGEVVEARSIGPLIDPNCPIEIVKIVNNQIIVKPINNSDT